MTEETFDYVIVGAGSAGCVLADRLTESGQDSVLLLEYGGSDRSVWIQMPSALNVPLNMPRYDWRYYTEPEPNLNNRRLHTPRGMFIGIDSAPGIWIQTERSEPPYSSSSTLSRPLSVRRSASTQPAEPAPTIT